MSSSADQYYFQRWSSRYFYNTSYVVESELMYSLALDIISVYYNLYISIQGELLLSVITVASYDVHADWAVGLSFVL